MFYENSNANRLDWKYPYKGKELQWAAWDKLKECTQKELAARVKCAELLQDSTVRHDSREVQDCRKDIEIFGKMREQCEVYVHEFNRESDRVFHLALGDVVFFNLIKQKDKQEKCPLDNWTDETLKDYKNK